MSILQDVRNKYKKLYNSSKKGTVERKVYYDLYLILVNARDRRQAASKIRALGVSFDEGQTNLCEEALEALDEPI